MTLLLPLNSSVNFPYIMAEDKNKSQMNPIVSGIAGAAVGAVATAAVMAMSDKKTREKVVNTFSSLKSRGQKKLNEFSKQAKDVASKTQQDLKKNLQESEPLKAV